MAYKEAHAIFFFFPPPMVRKSCAEFKFASLWLYPVIALPFFGVTQNPFPPLCHDSHSFVFFPSIVYSFWRVLKFFSRALLSKHFSLLILISKNNGEHLFHIYGY